MIVESEAKKVILGWLDRAELDAEIILRDLDVYIETLVKWQRIQNLVSRETLSEIWSRHIADSLQLLEFQFPKEGHVVDLGSGAGLPGIVMAIVLKDFPVKFSLIEANGRKCAFLREIVRACGLDANIVDRRIESLSVDEIAPVDLFTSRAFAPFGEMVSYIAPLWRPETRALFHKGKEFGSERQNAAANWDFDLVEYPSLIEAGSVVIDVRNLRQKF